MSMSTGNPGPDDAESLRVRLRELRKALDEISDLIDRAVTAEEALRLSEERFRMLVGGVRDYAIFMLDPQGYIGSWSLGAQLLKGYSASEIIGKHFSIFYPPEDLAAGKPARELEIATHEGRYEEEGWRLRKDGTRFWASVLITALFDTEGNLRGFGKVTRDLTERRRAEEMREQLRMRNRQLELEQEARTQIEATLRSRDEFLIAVAHELRTPITALLGYGQMMRRHFEHGHANPERDQRIIQAIIVQGERVSRLTNTMINMYRLNESSLKLNIVPLDLRVELARVASQLELLTDQHPLTTELPAEPLMIEGDEQALEQILYNLIQNAIKYSPAGGMITMRLRAADGQALITVADEGVGIPEDERERIFERFYRARNISGEQISGLGMGLYIVKEMVTLHHGTIDVASSLGKGSTFRVILPLKEQKQ
jgi:PAS domain S-box-containing protein